MPADVTTTSPTFAIEGDDAEPSDAAISALCRLLLAVADDTNTHSTPPAAAPVASVFFSAATNEEFLT